MNRIIDIKSALELKDTIFVDVRAPLEYEEDRIINSKNIPLLDDNERSIVGTLYKQEGKELAIEKGLKFTGEKLEYFYSEFINLSKVYKNIVIYCSRGGMRSSSLVNFLSVLGLNTYKLEGGYKSYRNYVIDFLENLDKYYEFIVLHGLTGVGKTDALKYLHKNDINTLDLEEFAKNSGSVFGHVYFNDSPPSQKLFESVIFNHIYELKSKYIFIESESKRIGGICLPNSMYDIITKKGYHILLEDSIDSRIERLVDQYVNLSFKDNSTIINSLEKLRKRLGNENVNYLIEKMNLKEYSLVAKELILNYYDPLYKYSIDKYEYELKLSCSNFENAMEKLILFYERLNEGSFK